MKKWNYSISTNTIWTSFDFGQVEAASRSEALVLAKAELAYAFEKVNNALKHSDNANHMTISYAVDQIEITEVK